MEAFVRREVVIENEEDPRGLFLVFELLHVDFTSRKGVPIGIGTT